MKLKKSQIFMIITFGAAALLLTMVLAAGLSSDRFGFGEKETGPRTHANTHDVDPVEAEVTALEIKWLDGPVTVGASPDGMIHITERSHRQLKEDQQMEVTVKSGALSVRWDSQWFRRWVNIGWFGMLDKELEVLLPPALAQELTSLKVENTSDSLTVAGCHASELAFSNVSGVIQVSGCAAEEQLSASTVSGDIILTGTTCDEAMQLNTTSGSVSVEDGFSQELSISTVSGGCRYHGSASALFLHTVSGGMQAELNNSPDEAGMEAVSGSLRLALPEETGFTAEFSSVSGAFRTDFPVESASGKSGKARCGTGAAVIRMSTTSGDMSIEKLS